MYGSDKSPKLFSIEFRYPPRTNLIPQYIPMYKQNISNIIYTIHSYHKTKINTNTGL